MADSIGMMEGAFFVSKGEIMSWVNNLLQINITKVEQFGTGAAYCQIIDSLYPGKVKMSRVNWKARNEWEFIVNLKTLQQAFQKCNIKKHIEIEKLAKAKYQDNLEFAQWIKRFYDLNGGVAKDYDPVKRRSGGDQDVEINFGFVDLRDNSKIHQMNSRKERNDSSESRIYQSKKLISRSKSPIIKNLEKNPPLLQNKSKEIQFANKIKSSKQHISDIESMVEAFKQIENITKQSGNNNNEVLQDIQKIVQQQKQLQLFKDFNKNSLNNNNGNNSPLQRNNRLKENNKIIPEEDHNESPKKEKKRTSQNQLPNSSQQPQNLKSNLSVVVQNNSGNNSGNNNKSNSSNNRMSNKSEILTKKDPKQRDSFRKK